MARQPGIERTRRTQAERSATTRENLLKAAIKCLFERGYGVTSTILVAKEAGVSRGGMLHQFPTRADLMTFVVEEVFAQEEKLYGRILGGIDDPRERLVAYPNAVWKVLSRPAGVAVLEILLGSRSDPDLAIKLAPVQAKIEAHAKEVLQREFPRGVIVPLLHLIVGAVRGLSVTQVISADKREIAQAIKLLQTLLESGIETGAFSKSAGKGSTRDKARRQSK